MFIAKIKNYEKKKMVNFSCFTTRALKKKKKSDPDKQIQKPLHNCQIYLEKSK